MIAPDFLRSKTLPIAALLGVFALAAVPSALALQPAQTQAAIDVQVFFTPGDDAAGKIIAAINEAHKQILVQAFSFTHPGIAGALIAAHRRGVDVRLIADREQTENIRHNRIPAIAAAGIPVWLDGQHRAAHNKVMVIDADSANIADVAVVAGSYNFTNAAQYTNAENVLLIRADRPLAKAYQQNWQRHQPHSKPWAAARQEY
ncbi:MAG TPA: phospholipase D family protein [Methylophilaceae bacterium]|nr:phospholipase D family protein [Methylophilaceae bacterium]